MKKKDIYHPKLYIDYKIDNDLTILYFYSNKFKENGDRYIEKEVLNRTNFSINEINKLNENQFKELKMYILRQEKVIEAYKKNKIVNKLSIVEDSLSIMNQFKKMFEDWFINNNSHLEKDIK